jgi:CheY-like chemotaxis protein
VDIGPAPATTPDPPWFGAVNTTSLWRHAGDVRDLARTAREDSARLRRAAVRHRRPIAGGAAGRHIGVVDDDASIRRAVSRLLRVAGFAVTVFPSGEALLAWEGIGTLDCLILDVHLDGLTGFAVGERLATAWPAMPVVFITANDDMTTGDRAGAGRHLVLRKPFDEDTLMGAIDTAVRESRAPTATTPGGPREP